MSHRPHDAFETPAAIAQKMVCAVRRPVATIVADFSAGAGALLAAAESRWPKARFFASDVSIRQVGKLNKLHPEWEILQADFLKDDVLNALKAYRDLRGKVSVVLLNPPFSCRGAFCLDVDFFGNQIRCSKAMSFLLRATTFLNRRGELVAVMPSGCLASERDSDAWAQLGKRFSTSIVGSNGNRAFDGCSPTTTIVHLSPIGKDGEGARSRSPSSRVLKNLNLRVAVVRGGHQLFATTSSRSPAAIRLVHTTNLRDGRICPPFQRIIARRWIATPGVLLPRVGTPSQAKVALIKSKGTLALSDCVIALECGSAKSAHQVKKRLDKNWEVIRQLYGGTCARFITLKTLTRGLHSIGIENSTAVNGSGRKKLYAKLSEKSGS